MKVAQYYIYFNLHKKCFSVKYKGRVIHHLDNFLATGVTFKVSEKGRQKVIEQKRKNVHAYIVCDILYSFDKNHNIDYLNELDRIKYNPYKYASFVDQNENPVYNLPVVYGYVENCKGILVRNEKWDGMAIPAIVNKK